MLGEAERAVLAHPHAVPVAGAFDHERSPGRPGLGRQREDEGAREEHEPEQQTSAPR